MIEVHSLCKQFGDVAALDDISFSVESGAICGFIGPNGAGKTTTMRILATLEHADSGEAAINGHSVALEPIQVRQLMGYMPDYYGAYPDMAVSEYLDFFARAYRLSAQQRITRVNDIVDFTELHPLMSRPVEGLSKGQKQRLSLARSLLSDPSVLILDEPAAGLDPRARIELRELLKILAQQGKTIFISSHILTELSDLVDYIVIIDHGKIRFSGRLNELNQTHAGGVLYTLELVSEDEAARKFLLTRPAVREVSGEGELLHLRFDEQTEAPEAILSAMIEHGIRLRQFYRRRDDLESVFMQVTE
ncbi:MAG: ABC transporter ATP-binding protein [Pseudomonadota bacterium]